MPPIEMNDEQIKALIINFLLRRTRWGGRYYNTQKMVRYLGQDVLNDGKEVSRCLKLLMQDRWINSRKKRKTISLNSSHTKEISEFRDKHLFT